jgi:hypothetical protein
MLRRTIMAGMLLAPLILSACDDKDTAGPTGTPGTVSVRAYVDSDGSGTFTTGDVPVSGASVTLTPTSTSSALPTALLTAQTDAQGIAKFPTVAPGSYTAALTGTVPPGAVLSSATHPVVVIPFAGGDISSEFRFVNNPGSISGQLFRDNNGNNVFDAGDTPAPGMPVALFPGTDTTAEPVATTTTDNNGVFTFSAVRPGVYTLKVTPIPTIQIVGGTTQSVTVSAATATAFPLKFTGNLIGTIAEARAKNPLDSAIVAVEGVVSAGVGTFNASSSYIQDATAGILVFGINTTEVQPKAGDRVRVIGKVVSFREELEIVSPTVTILSSGAPPTPRTVTGAQINAFQFQGELANVGRVKVVSVAGGTAAGFDVHVVDAAGTDFVVRVANAATGLTRSSFTVGSFYSVTGVLNRFNAVAQLQPRTAADIVAAPSSIPIGTARLRPVGDTVTITGVVTAGVGVFSTSATGNQFNVQDESGGILILDTPLATGPAQGDSVQVRGVLVLSGGELLLRSPTITKLGTGTVPAPLFISADYAAKSTAADPLQGMLVRANNLRIKSVSGTATSTSFNVVAFAPSGDTLTIRVGTASTGIAQTFFQVGSSYDVTGTLAQFNGPQIKVRKAADVTLTATPAGVKTIAQARAVVADADATNDTVTVEGVVSAGRGTFRNDNAYIQDGTAGVQIFNLPSTLSLNVGDIVRVRGKMVIFGNTATGAQELEITNVTTPGDSIRVTKIGTGAPPTPLTVTGAQLVARTAEGQLVRVNDVTVTSITTPGTSGTYTVNGTTPDGTAIIVFMSAPTGAVPPPTGLFTVGGHYDLIGIEVPFFTNGARIGELKPRGAADVIAR